jgi:dihydroorotate dehydrogenase electron transfer subunit
VIHAQFPVVNQIEITKNIYRLTVTSEPIVRECHPGQFVQVRVNDGIDPLLRRPLSIHRVYRDRNTLDLLYRVVGCGTHRMRFLGKGDRIDLMGPLGKGFRIDRDFRQAVIVVGGMGSAPLFFLIDELIRAGKNIVLYWGVKDKSEIIDLPELKKNGVEVHVTTENGSIGHKGLITDLFSASLHIYDKMHSIRGFVCGPKEMIRAMQTIASKTPFQWQVSLEERMACGIGVCQGCGVKMKDGEYKMVCSDGPIFDLSEVILND